MARTINIADSKGRNAEIVFIGNTKKPTLKQITQDGRDVDTIRVLKGTAKNSFEYLSKKNKDPENLVKEFINADPEIDLQLTGRFIQSATRVYIDEQLKPVSRVVVRERVYSPDGTLKEERIPKETLANILSELPIRGGKLFPKKEVGHKFVFSRKYQLTHINGLTFDFLYTIAKDLQEQEALMMVGGGPKGTEPLVFQDGGKSYRAFLEGREKSGKYILLLHLSNLELKAI
ncbi:MAG: hypothetical protein LW688_04275 [Cryomorphaceae bacterium]|jgi:hypothetical protein|nr:hypothetical protein [Cryomorphaceae bacterium]